MCAYTQRQVRRFVAPFGGPGCKAANFAIGERISGACLIGHVGDTIDQVEDKVARLLFIKLNGEFLVWCIITHKDSRLQMKFVDHLAIGEMAQHWMNRGDTMTLPTRIIGVDKAERISAFGEAVKAQLQCDGEELLVLSKLRLLQHVVHGQLGEPLYLL